ncbi:unnamed protein product [Rhizoctonia solani]|uniref:F-box domain-containing protein n=1 Tax=Rhizoctonia solani TaxID=456999 RepID=A0A8H2WBX8_9AGAM|nr:unnamed protein product [Rhizoctonia solani]
MQGLRAARRKLESALQAYEDACLTITKCSWLGITSDGQTLSEMIETEIESYATFCSKAVRSRAILKRVRNAIPSLVPIYYLPDELLLRIFYSVMHQNLFALENIIDDYSLPTHILAISQVCSQWRQIALDSRGLWTDIQISTPYKMLALGETLADRAGELPLDIRIVEPFGGWYFDRRARGSIISFFSRVGAQVASFKFDMITPLNENLSRTHMHFLERSLMNLRPGQCTRLTLTDRNSNAGEELEDECYETSEHWFLLPRSTTIPASNHASTVSLDIDPEHFEDVLAQVTILELNSMVYPYWTSKAYHGLVELSLMGPRRLTTVITIQQLAGIMTSSPYLRVLYFGLEVSLTKVAPRPVHLADLETFLLHSLHHDTQQAVLNLIDSGPKPLQMSTTYNELSLGCLPASFEDEFRRFFVRSNIVELEIHGSEPEVKMPELLKLLPNLEILIIRNSHIEYIKPSDQDKLSGVACPRLHTLRLRYCSFPLDAFQWIASVCDLQNVTLLHCTILPETGIPYHRAEGYESTLKAICPAIRFVYHMHDAADGIEERAPMDLNSRIPTASLTDYKLY